MERPQGQQEMAVLTAALNIARHEETMRNVLRYITLTVDSVRKENDTSTVRRVIRNQGKIAALTELRECIEKGLPSV